jgi:hypothetical protein
MIPGLLGACSTLAPSESSLPVGATEIAAPAVYQEWLQRTEACSGIAGDLSTMKFYVVPGVGSFPTHEGAKVGEWNSDGHTNRIIIAGNYRNHEMVVSHELLHSLLNRTGHPAEYFVTRCKLTWETWNGADGGVALGGGD